MNANDRMLAIIVVEDFGNDPTAFLVEYDPRRFPTGDAVGEAIAGEAHALVERHREWEDAHEEWEDAYGEWEDRVAEMSDGCDAGDAPEEPEDDGMADFSEAMCWLTGDGRGTLEARGIHVLGEGDRAYAVATVWNE